MLESVQIIHDIVYKYKKLLKYKTKSYGLQILKEFYNKIELHGYLVVPWLYVKLSST